MERYVSFQFDCNSVLIKADFPDDFSLDKLMELAYEMNENGEFEDCSYEEVVDILLKCMEINKYEMIECSVVDMEYAFEMN
jgi:hypothetical protein